MGKNKQATIYINKIPKLNKMFRIKKSSEIGKESILEAKSEKESM